MILAYAVTIHKCQGLSLDCAIMDLSHRVFCPGMAYVALSRVKTLCGVYLTSFDPQSVMVDSKCLQEFNRLRLLHRPDLPSYALPTVCRKRKLTGQLNANTDHQKKKSSAALLRPVQPTTVIPIPCPKKKRGSNQDYVPSNRKMKRRSPAIHTGSRAKRRHVQLSESVAKDQTMSGREIKTPLLPATPDTSEHSKEPDLSVVRVEQGTVQVTGPLPSREWKKQVLVTLHHYSGLKRKPADKTDLPDPVQIYPSPDIHPHTRDMLDQDGNCLFRALSKELTGTERNHRVLRLAIINYMSQNPSISEYAGVGSMVDYLFSSKMGHLGTWGTDMEILTLATMLDIDVVVSAISGRGRELHAFQPVLDLLTSTNRVSWQQRQNPNRLKVYLYHTDARNHYDRLVPSLSAM